MRRQTTDLLQPLADSSTLALELERVVRTTRKVLLPVVPATKPILVPNRASRRREGSALDDRRETAMDASTLLEEATRSFSDSSATTLAMDVCGDMERELAAIETRLAYFRSLQETAFSPQYHAFSPRNVKDEALTPGSDAKPKVNVEATRDTSSRTALKKDVGVEGVDPERRVESQRAQQQQAGQVADEVENALQNCDRLLERARSIGKKRLRWALYSSDLVNRRCLTGTIDRVIALLTSPS